MENQEGLHEREREPSTGVFQAGKDPRGKMKEWKLDLSVGG